MPNKMSYEEYTWSRYYEDICRRQKKLNNNLAVELGELTARREEAEIALNRIIKSPIWKAMSPARKIYGKLKGKNSDGDGTCAAGLERPATSDTSVSLPDDVYSRRLWMYEDYYAQWIKKDPIEIRYADHADSGMSRVRTARYHIVYIEDCAGMRAPFDASIRNKWILFTSRNGMLAEGYAERLDAVLDTNPDAMVAYADEDLYYTTSEGIHRIEPFFKPDWSPDTLDSFFYFGNFALMRTDVAIRSDWYGSKDALSNVYDLFLQVADKIGKHYDETAVVHIPQVLFHNCADSYMSGSAANSPGSLVSGSSDVHNDSYALWKNVTSGLKDDLESGRHIPGAQTEYDAVKARSMKRRGVKATFIDGQIPGQRHILYSLPAKHKVSALILTKDHPDILRKLLESFTERTDYDDLEFVIVDNGSDPDHRAEYLSLINEILSGYHHEYIYEKRDFNFSALCNRAAQAANGDLLLFMNDDIEIVQKDWLKLMAGYATRPHVGAVGAKLLYADSDLIQHAGVTSMEIGPSHKLVIYPDDRSYYYGRNSLEYDMLGVTAACLLIETAKFDASGGFNEDFPVAYNDVELCMRLSRMGYNNVQCNGSLLYHHESLTRGLDEGDENKWDRLLNEKNRLYQIYPEFSKADPYYNPNLIGNHSNYLSNFDYGYNNHIKCESVRQIDAGELAETEIGAYKISIDFAGIQPKITLQEPEIIEIRGWSFLSGSDNSLHHVNLILKNNTNGTIYRVKTDPVPRKDLEETFPSEINNRLCGFESRVLRQDLATGSYMVGIEPIVLNHDLTDAQSQQIVIYSGSVLDA